MPHPRISHAPYILVLSTALFFPSFCVFALSATLRVPCFFHPLSVVDSQKLLFFCSISAIACAPWFVRQSKKPVYSSTVPPGKLKAVLDAQMKDPAQVARYLELGRIHKIGTHHRLSTYPSLPAADEAAYSSSHVMAYHVFMD